jgi:hypothetical protein
MATIAEGKSILNRVVVVVTAHEEAFEAERFVKIHDFLT